MRAETDGQAEGWVLEASIKSMGKVATVLVRRGAIRPGDFIVAGKTWARICCLRNETGVEIVGITGSGV
jgi:translation initiation factor IF-2